MSRKVARGQLSTPAAKPGVEALAVLLIVLALLLDDSGAVPEVRDCQRHARGAPWGLRRRMVQQPAVMPAHIPSSIFPVKGRSTSADHYMFMDQKILIKVNQVQCIPQHITEKGP